MNFHKNPSSAPSCSVRTDKYKSSFLHLSEKDKKWNLHNPLDTDTNQNHMQDLSSYLTENIIRVHNKGSRLILLR
jgi:hypothetical protein